MLTKFSQWLPKPATLCFLLTLVLLTPAVRAADDYLEPEKAFAFSAVLTSPQQVTVTYKIADGYYMYRERFQFKAEGATLGSPVFPPGKVKFDETFKKSVETYRHSVEIQIPVTATGSFSLTSTGQGCADAGLCYAPMDSEARLGQGSGLLESARRLGIGQSGSVDTPTAIMTSAPASASPQTVAGISDHGTIERTLKSGRYVLILPLFLLLGLGLAFTPCVLPMVPILSTIIVGEGVAAGRGRAFMLSVAYSLGMAIVYTLLGVAAGLAGEGLAATLQNPWVLSAFALVMVGLALSMFGVYQVQMSPICSKN